MFRFSPTQFAAFIADEARDVGYEALETELPYDQKDVLVESKVYISKCLVKNVTLDVTIYNLDEPDIPGPDSKKSKAEPSKPTLALESS